jgi:hypothetical protein
MRKALTTLLAHRVKVAAILEKRSKRSISSSLTFLSGVVISGIFSKLTG